MADAGRAHQAVVLVSLKKGCYLEARRPEVGSWSARVSNDSGANCVRAAVY